jgi:C4-dicarboxylate transporter/malic acid transport protein
VTRILDPVVDPEPRHGQRVRRARPQPREVAANLSPNWFASVMGTGIVAVAAASLPDQFPGLRGAATAVWAAAAVLLVVLVGVTARQWVRYPSSARRFLADGAMAPFFGAVPMAVLTVGAGTLLLGRDVVGLRAAVDVDWVLWSAGTVLGLACAAGVPYLMITRFELSLDCATGGWLMPIVPPMVSAATGALLVPYAPAGQLRLATLLGCYAMFGLSLVASLIVIAQIWFRLTTYGLPEARLVPTLWIVLGPLGQSVTAANQLGGVAHLAVPAPYAGALQAFGMVYGVPVWGFAMLWGALATAVTVRTARDHLPFSLTWWSFTFPVGTCVTGTIALATHLGSDALRGVSVILFGGLVLAWIVVATRTADGAVRGELFPRAAASALR